MPRSGCELVVPVLLVVGLVGEPAPAGVSDHPDPAPRLAQVTADLLGRPYVASPLGEGEGIDPDPRYRLDAFDCTTFVETAIALSWSRAEGDVPALLDRLRYRDGRVSFAQRRHLISSQWLPDLQAVGFLVDVTEGVGREETAEQLLVLSAERWRRRSVARELPLSAAEVPSGTFSIRYVPLGISRQRADEIPPGSVLSVVRDERSDSPILVTHQGLVLDTEAGKVVRHASPVWGRVVDEPLHSFLERLERHRRWPVAGINLQRIQAAPDGTARE